MSKSKCNETIVWLIIFFYGWTHVSYYLSNYYKYRSSRNCLNFKNFIGVLASLQIFYWIKLFIYYVSYYCIYRKSCQFLYSVLFWKNADKASWTYSILFPSLTSTFLLPSNYTSFWQVLYTSGILVEGKINRSTIQM